jgi:hypothetical protein
MGLLGRFPEIPYVRVLDCTLIETCRVESPDPFFIKAMVNDGLVAIRRIRVHTLSLGIIEVQLLIIVFSGNHWGFSNGGTFFGVELFESFPVVVLHEADIVNVFQKSRIVLDALVESLEGVVQIGGVGQTTNDGVHAEMNTNVDLRIEVLSLVSVDSCLLICAFQS